MIAFYFSHDRLFYPAVDVITAQLVLAVGGVDVKESADDGEYGNIKGPAAEIVDHDPFFLVLFKTIGEGRSGWFVDHPYDIDARYLPRIFYRLALAVRKVRRHRDHGILEFYSHPLLGVRKYFLDHMGADVLGRVVSPPDLFPEPRAHLPFDGGNRPRRIGDHVAFCDLAHHHLAALFEINDRGSVDIALPVLYHRRLVHLNERHFRVGGTKIDTQYSSFFEHFITSCSFSCEEFDRACHLFWPAFFPKECFFSRKGM